MQDTSANKRCPVHGTIQITSNCTLRYEGLPMDFAVGQSAVMFQIRKVLLDSAVGTATRYGVNGPRIESRWGEIFRTRPDRPWGPPSLLYNGYRDFPGSRAAGAWLCSPSGLSWSVLGRILLYFTYLWGAYFEIAPFFIPSFILSARMI
jgi:hypothetical protein